MRNCFVGRLLGATSIIALSVCVDGYAQAQNADSGGSGDTETVVVTGTLIRGEKPASPILTIDQSDIQTSGAVTADQLLGILPQFSTDSATVAGFTGTGDAAALNNRTAGASANLRGFGGDSTLVLLDGNRLAPNFAGHFVDVSMIPVSAIERVEVETDGGSAEYGSDAIGGVVNFILRKDYDGAETSGLVAVPTDGGGVEYDANQLFGKDWSTGSVLLDYEFYHSDPVTSAQRSFSSNASSPNYLLPAQQRHSLFGSAQQSIGADIDLHANILFSDRGSETDVTRNDLADGSEYTNAHTQSLNASAGVTIALPAGWSGDVTGLYSRDSDDEHEFEAPDPEYVISESYSLWSVDAKSDGPIFSLPAGMVKAAIGGGYREEQISQQEQGVVTATDGIGRNIYYAYGELNVPVLSDANSGLGSLDITVAGRFDHYSDFGSTVNPKYGVTYSPISDLKFRGTYSTAFKAPDLEDLVTADNDAILYNYPDPSAPGGHTLTLILNGGNPNLKPETATSTTFGADWQPERWSGLKVSATYFHTDYRNRITLVDTADPSSERSISSDGDLAPLVILNPTTQYVTSLLNASPVFYNLYGPYTPNQVKAIYNNLWTNASESTAEGIDLSVSYLFALPSGQLLASFEGTYLDKLTDAITPTAPEINLANTVYEPAALKFRAGLTYRFDGATVSGFMNYTGGYTDNLNTPHTSVGAWTTFDIQGSQTIWDGGRVTLSVRNLFDENPPHIVDYIQTQASGINIGYDPANANPWGRIVSISFNQRW